MRVKAIFRTVPERRFTCKVKSENQENCI
jgi:hypothetical protein